MRLLGRLVAAAALVLATGLVVAAPGQAAALGQCTTASGTIVAVDFGPWGGPIVRGCGVQQNGQPDSTGYVLLGDGGFSVTGDQHDGPAFVCRLGSGSFNGGAQYPTAAQDRCVVTPPASASWSFWLAPPGATSWQHSNDGATSDHPVAGEVELWTFGGSGPPASGLIDQLRARNTAPAGGSPAAPTPSVQPTSSPPTGPGSVTGPTSQGSPRATGLGGNDTASPQPTTGAPSSSGASTSGTTSPTAGDSAIAGTTPGAPPSIVTARAAQKSPHHSGSALPIVITVVLVAGLGGLGGLSLVRRRRSAGD
ncbi:MAG TPA: hypothetical protein VIJ71_02620 [Mycobacteriales bacterium]